jgi:hypothetical protein
MTLQKDIFKMSLVFLALFLLGLLIPHVYAQDTCIGCHKDEKFRTQNKKLFDYYSLWRDSVHEINGAKCIDCHGGDPKKRDKEDSHKRAFSSLNPDIKVNYKKISLICGRCHKEILKNFINSKHYKSLRSNIVGRYKGVGPNCVTCHGAMNTGIYEAHNVGKGCEVCHNEETKNNPEMGRRAEDILTNANFIRAYRQWIELYYADKQPETVKEINTLYKNIVLSWHQFNFEQIDEKSKELLMKLKSIYRKGLEEQKKKKQQ